MKCSGKNHQLVFCTAQVFHVDLPELVDPIDQRTMTIAPPQPVEKDGGCEVDAVQPGQLAKISG